MQDLERPENRFRLFPFLLSSLSLPFLHWLTTLSVIAIESILHPSIPPSNRQCIYHAGVPSSSAAI